MYTFNINKCRQIRSTMILGVDSYMPRQLWNEGRVVGLSAYEVYLKQHLSKNPDIEPATEIEWLAASIASGSSMILKISAHATAGRHIVDYPLPADSRLCAANLIFGNFFSGDVDISDASSPFGYRLSSVGQTVSNTEHSHPIGSAIDATSIPNQVDDTDLFNSKANEYNKILDGVVIQPGNWEDTGAAAPAADLVPNMKLSPTVRILFKDKVDVDFYVVLTGFTNRSVISGVAGMGGSFDPIAPLDGTAFGPAQFPWAAKIIFNTSNYTLDQAVLSNYSRKLPTSASEVSVKGKPIIDMATTDPNRYYHANLPDAQVTENVVKYSSPDNQINVLTTYTKKDKYPPALYGGIVTKTGENTISPIGVVSEGSVKIFDKDATKDDIKDYEDTYPGTSGIRKNDDGTMDTLDNADNLVKIAEVSHKKLIYNNIVASDSYVDGVVTRTGNKSAISLSLSPNGNDTQYTLGNDGDNNKSIGNTTFGVGNLPKLSPNSSNITFPYILEAMSNNKSIDILGDSMKLLKAGLNKSEPYVQLPNGLRFYISATKPTATDVPIGSIGVGWTEE